ncbi:FtsK-like domain-containing protein [Symmachiella macrocystis]|uniref:FtsK-like domain-containing protein n=1 Tax=Symmachiella macrocystis TaxID=2527985 RepID=A0A5C6BMI1_9PLAN|nr:FtsK/SpoIIIE domain-containing protein [Symmachiella macrocystis]TWU12496.1 FtsK-like domain-containing protein [Symmachiella macrocystis]
MSNEDPTTVERRLVAELHDQLNSRNRRWRSAAEQHSSALQAAEELYADGLTSLNEELSAAQGVIENEQTVAAADVEVQYNTESGAARHHYSAQTAEFNRTYDRAVAASKKTHDDTAWMVSSVLDDDSGDSPKRKLEELTHTLQNSREHLIENVEALADDIETAKTILQQRRQRHESLLPEVDPVPTEPDAAYECCEKATKRGRGQLLKLRRDVPSQLLTGWRPAVLFVVSSAACFLLAFLLLPPTLLGAGVQQSSIAWIATTAGSAAGLTVVAMVILYAIAASRCESAIQEMEDAFATAELSLHNWRSWSDQELRKKQRRFQQWHDSRIEQRDRTVAQATEKHEANVAHAARQRQADQERLDTEFAAQIEGMEQQRNSQMERINSRRQAALASLARRTQQDPETIRSVYETSRQQAEQTHTAETADIVASWNQFWTNCVSTQQDLAQRAAACALSDDALQSDSWQLPEQVPEGIRFGNFDVDICADAAVVDDERVASASPLEFPVLLPFASGPSLFLQADGAGRRTANDTLRAVMLRILTSLPAGKVRFTIIDPVGLGEQFSSFMHLADYDELLINSRIWTEGTHIEQRLADLTEHMENVFQTYLRNEYKSIEEYNEFAGEVAEPYHFLVVADFPANIGDVAARRLISIVNSGARCGVNTLMSYDPSRPLPHGTELEDFVGSATHLVWHDDHFEFVGEELAGSALKLDAPPESAQFTQIVRRAGDLSKNARRVEVPFDRIAPAEADMWQHDSRSGIDVPLGRAGATSLQHLRLGRGTSQHVLVAGKTGSGKSTFLHALITNTALHYGPDEVEFYLVDFKKGVEFKAYATGHLPHARVIAIESDREFGVSVLQRLDAVLTERGELFRAHGVQDVEMFRNALPNERMPRIMLLVDEFQEFFTEDDKLSQNASLLLDRLVRQGRAFGIHVLLGSQSLGGAYSLARSTLGQVAVRIALQCSEADAHLILSEDNTAARLLTRPGEAIYNDANGLLDGNHPFQIAWLNDEQRSEKLRRMYNSTLRGGQTHQPPVVFEGNVPSDPQNNSEINELISAFPPSTPPTRGRVWLGEPVELKAASAVEFPRQAGSNLLITGQSVDSALGTLTSCLSSLGYQYPPPNEAGQPAVQFHVLDALASEHGSLDMWNQAVSPTRHNVDVGGPDAVERMIDELAAVVDRRLESPHEPAPPIYFFAVNLSGFRELRKDDDDFGSWGSSDDKPLSASKQFAKILTDGPTVGVHVLMWCDSYNNVNRWLGNKLLKEIEIRVCFRMNANDSSQIIDTPAAGRLGPNRALLYHDSTGETEKFRPYGVLLEPAPLPTTTVPQTGEEKSGGNWNSLEMFSVN